MIIGIDTQVLIYAEAVPSSGIKSAEFSNLSERAKLLIYNAAENGDTIVLPTIVVSELLVPVQPSQRASLVQLLEKTFQCPPFDIPAATIASDLWTRFRSLPPDQQNNSSRTVLRADALIVASARAANATHFYSHDAQCRTLAKLAGMTALDLPIPLELGEQFLVSDMKTNTVPELRTPTKGGSAKSKRKRKSSRNR